MAKPVQKKAVFGYALWIRRFGGEGLWERQGHLFYSPHEALTYQLKHWPTASSVKVCAVRLNVEPVVARV